MMMTRRRYLSRLSLHILLYGLGLARPLDIDMFREPSPSFTLYSHQDRRDDITRGVETYLKYKVTIIRVAKKTY